MGRRRTDFPFQHRVDSWFDFAPAWAKHHYSKEMKQIREVRSNIPFAKLNTIEGAYKDCHYRCTYEEIEFEGESKMLVMCGLGFEDPQNAPLVAKKDFEEEIGVALDRYEHEKFIPLELWGYLPDRPKEYRVLSRFEFFSDIDLEDVPSSKEETDAYIRKEFEEAVDFYESVTKSLGKRKCFGSRRWPPNDKSSAAQFPESDDTPVKLEIKSDIPQLILNKFITLLNQDYYEEATKIINSIPEYESFSYNESAGMISDPKFICAINSGNVPWEKVAYIIHDKNIFYKYKSLDELIKHGHEEEQNIRFFDFAYSKRFINLMLSLVENPIFLLPAAAATLVIKNDLINTYIAPMAAEDHFYVE